MNSAEDFLLLLLHTHTIAAAKRIQSLLSLSSVTELAHAIVVNFIRLPLLHSKEKPQKVKDGVYVYAVELLTLTLFWHGFHDAIKEGDGDRILRYWKFLLVLFKSSTHRNYAKEAVHVLLQYYYFLSQRQRHQLLWSRCVNTRGFPGKNIPCDLHMEHLNRRLKNVLKNMGANITPKAIEKAGKSIAAVQHVCQIFEEQTATGSKSGHHTYPKLGKDFQTILSALQEQKVFETICERQHKTFKIDCHIMEKLSKEELLKKVKVSIDQLYLA